VKATKIHKAHPTPNEITAGTSQSQGVTREVTSASGELSGDVTTEISVSVVLAESESAGEVGSFAMAQVGPPSRAPSTKTWTRTLIGTNSA
jgi:hypothetical protein